MQLKTLGQKSAVKEKPKILGAFEDTIEALPDIPVPQEFLKAASTQTSEINKEFVRQLLGLENKVQKTKDAHGEIFNGNAESHDKKAAKPVHKDAAIEYHREFRSLSESRTERISNHEMQSQVQQLLGEIQQLSKASKQLESQFKHVAGEQAPEQAGKYHVNFLEWLLLVVRQARQKVESSNTWLAAFKGKKGGKGYWDMFQKQGTSFAMSNERNVATQTG